MPKPKSQYRPNLPEIKEGVRILWTAAYYDGPLSGVALYNGVPHGFELKREYDGREMRKQVWRTYWLHKFTDEQWKEVEYWHNEFRLHVGQHCDYEFAPASGKLQRVVGHGGADMAYFKEMFYDRKEAFEKEHGGSLDNRIDRYNQTVGYVTWEVLFGNPWTEWRRPRKKKARERVSREKEGT